MAEGINTRELNKGVKEAAKELGKLEKALPEVTQGIGELERGAEEAGSEPCGEREALHQAGGQWDGGGLQAGGRLAEGAVGQSD